MERAGVVFEVVASPADEIHDNTMEPMLLCETNAALKAMAVAEIHPLATVIGSDTLVFIGGKALGKPKDLQDANAMLQSLSGKVHQVCTGVCIVFPNGRKEVFHGLTEVVFRELDDLQIESYFSLVNPLDKAGSYGIQEYGDLLIEEIRGSFENVMGLPVDMVIECLATGVPAGTCEKALDEGVSPHGAAPPLSVDL